MGDLDDLRRTSRIAASNEYAPDATCFYAAERIAAMVQLLLHQRGGLEFHLAADVGVLARFFGRGRNRGREQGEEII